MQIEVETLDQNGKYENSTRSVSTFALLKHMAIAGQGFRPAIAKYTRMVGMFFRYIDYLSLSCLRSSRFSEPPPIRQDPTEKGQFSNLVGKAIGDCLARRISGAHVTLNYEGVMLVDGNKIEGERPDLYCLGDGYQFAVETKGYSRHTISKNAMDNHKDQSTKGPLAVNFTIASVAYNLYRKIKANYYDPNNENVRFNDNLNYLVLKSYYQGLFEYVKAENLPLESGEMGGRPCFFIRIIGPETPYPFTIGDKYSLYLVIDESFKTFCVHDHIPKSLEFLPEHIEIDSGFLDTDGVGVALRRMDSKGASEPVTDNSPINFDTTFEYLTFDD